MAQKEMAPIADVLLLEIIGLILSLTDNNSQGVMKSGYCTITNLTYTERFRPDILGDI